VANLDIWQFAASGQLVVQTMKISQGTEEVCSEVQGPRVRIALLTPYTGGNLGDAAIQDSMIANLRSRLPCAKFTGITLNCENFIKKHGVFAFPLLASSVPLPFGSGKKSEAGPGESERSNARSEGLDRNGFMNLLKRALRSVPGLAPIVQRARAWTAGTIRSVSHSCEAYRLLRKHDLFIVSGGGQLDDEWGGAWQLPFALCKWILLARLAGVPCAMASVGAGKISSLASRLLFSTALRLSSYRSYRETNTRTIAARLMSRAADDPVVVDLAFSLPESELPVSVGKIRSAAQGRSIIAVSPIAFAKPLNWPTPDRAVHDRYVQEMAKVLSCLSRHGYFPIVVCSSLGDELGDDESVIPEILEHLDDDMKQSLSERSHFPEVKTWRDFAAVLREADYLIASRLHGTILGFLTETPTVAISFDPKVDWVMEDLNQADYLLQIRDFTAEQVLQTLERIKVRRFGVIDRLISYRKSILAPAAEQYDSLSKLAQAHRQSHP
jgi:polysaccharide pyruvyl transferase WcaK-like protein